MKSEIFSTAWSLIKSGTFPNFSAALKAAWSKFKAKDSLKNFICEIEFVKKSTGEVTTRLGTLAQQLLPVQIGSGEKKVKPAPANMVTFFDMEAMAFRSFLIENLLTIKIA